MISRRKLQCALVAGLLALTLFLGYLIWSGRMEAIHTAEATTRGYAAVLEARLDATLRRSDAELQQLVRSVPVVALNTHAAPTFAQELNAMLDSRMFEFPELDGLRLFDANGDLLYTTNRATTPKTNISDREHFRKARDNPKDGPVFSEVLLTRTTGKLSLAVTRALRDEHGIFRGVAVATLNFEHFLKLMQSLDVGPKGIVAIYRRDDFRQVLRWPAVSGKLNVPLPGGSPAQTAFTGEERTVTIAIASAIDHTTRIYSFHALQRYPFFVSVGIAREDALAGWWQRSLVVGVFTLLLVALLIGLLHRLWRADAERNRLAAIAEGSNDAIYIRDVNGAIVYWNDGARRLYGYAAAEVLGRDSTFLVPLEMQDERQRNMVRLQQGGTVANYETVRRRKDGSSVDVSIGVFMVKDNGGATVGAATIARDITERLQAKREIEQLATRDELTGLSNRNKLMEQMNVAISRAARAKTHLAVMFIDLDKFKTVNDTLGHDYGDALLRACATRLTSCVREVDLVARLGGDEFMVVLTDITDAGIVPPIANRMLQLLGMPYQSNGHDMQTSASIGVSIYPADGADVATLIKTADIAMYHAKESSRNDYQFYAEEMNLRILRQAQLERELRAALENDEFVLHYQPQVDVVTGEIRGVESLIRWQHPDRGLLYPGDFIAMAEESGLVVRMGEWVINHACHTIKTWRAQGLNIPYVGVNVSAAQLNEQLVSTVRQALVKHGIEAGRLMLEITETMLMERVDEAISILQRIRELGVRIGMDDFGTGYSSLSVLQRLPLDTLKIDRSFVSTIDEASDNTRALAIIGAIIAISKELNLGVVAEGVEKPMQLAFLRTLNCDTYQGYLYSKPLDATALETRCATRARSLLQNHQDLAATQTSNAMLQLPFAAA